MRKLTNEDRARVLDYVGKEPEMNLFFIGDIENYGVDVPPVSLYVNETENGQWDSLLLRYFDFWLLYSQQGDYDTEAVAETLRGETVDCLSGKTELLKPLLPYFPSKALQSDYMCSLTKVNDAAIPALERNVSIRKLGIDDLDDYLSLMTSCTEFSKSYQGEGALEKRRNELVAKMQNETGSVIMGLYVDGQLISSASTSADNSQSVMIVGVATREGYRRKGYASAVVGELCRDQLATGKKTICLFYDNPLAGRIYRKIGFKEIGEYAMMR